MLDHAFELRYQVYCLERGFLPPSDYPNQRESDEHDDDAAHFGAYAQGDDLVGYVRLVQAHRGKFPFEAHCTTLLNDAALPPAATTAEISRLMVRQDYRCGRRQSLRRVDENDLAPAANAALASEASNILLAMYRRMYAYSLANGITHWYAAMERSLARSLRRWNFAFTQISAETDYFGPVALYVADLRDLEQRLAASNPELLAFLQAPDTQPAPGQPAVATGPMHWRVRHTAAARKAAHAAA